MSKAEAEVVKKEDGGNSFYNRIDPMSSGIIDGDYGKRTSGLLVCSECCNGNLCSSDGCGNNGKPLRLRNNIFSVCAIFFIGVVNNT